MNAVNDLHDTIVLSFVAHNNLFTAARAGEDVPHFHIYIFYYFKQSHYSRNLYRYFPYVLPLFQPYEGDVSRSKFNQSEQNEALHMNRSPSL